MAVIFMAKCGGLLCMSESMNPSFCGVSGGPFSGR